MKIKKEEEEGDNDNYKHINTKNESRHVWEA